MNRLKKYEERFYTAINADYTRNMSSAEMNEIIDIYEEVTGIQYGDRNWSCGSCVLRALKLVGRYYYDHRKESKNNKGVKEGKAS